MRILLTGSTGLVGRALLDAARSRHEVVPTYRAPPDDDPEAVVLDLEDPVAFAEVFAWTMPDVLVHAGAMTDVDACEDEPDRAHRINATATQELAELCESHGARMVYLSTDQVFDGKEGGYAEDDPTGPVNVYGTTKLDGERRVAAASNDALVVRTSVVYAPHGRHFVGHVLSELRAGRPVRAATDQRVSPTYAPDLAETLLTLLDEQAYGTYHAAGATALTRHEMALAVAEGFELDADLVEPTTMAQLDWRAPRPADTSLDVSKVAALHPPQTFADGLAALRAALP